MAKAIRIATYSRVSTAHHFQNPDVQVQELRRHCDARGWLIAHELVDHGHSGATDQRPGLKRLQALVRSREVDGVVVVKLDRLFRSLRHLISTLEEWQELGIQFVAIRDNVDYSSPASRFFVQVLGSLSEFERALAIDRTLAGLDHARRCGKVLGRPKVRDDDAIRALRATGLSYAAIQKRLGVSKGTVCRALKGTPKSVSENPSDSAMDSRDEK